MDQVETDHIRHELEIAANKLFPDWIRRVELLQHDDAPWMEPGQLSKMACLSASIAGSSTS